MTARDRSLALVLAGILGVAAEAVAQNPQPPASPLRELSLEQLGSLEVTTMSKQPADVWRTAASITVITQDDIRRAGVTTLPELLRFVSGVQVSRLDSDHWAIGIRGLTSAFSKALLVLIDGRSVYTPLFGGVYWQVQDTPIEDVDRIEVIRGPGGTIWGSNAVNGVINVITKQTGDTPGLLVSAGAGNVDQGRAVVRYGASLTNAVSYRVYADGALRNPQHHTDGRSFDEWSLAQTGFRLDVNRPRDSLRVQGDAYTGTMGEMAAIAQYTPPSRTLIDGSDLVGGGHVLASWERVLPRGGGMRLQGYYDRTRRDAIHYGERRDTVDVDVLLRTRVGRRHQISWGAGARNSRSDFTPVFPTLTMVPEDRDQRLASLFAQDEIAVLPDQLFVTVGTKFEHNTYSGWEVQPSARLLWRVDLQESLWASATRAVRTPSRLETDLRLTAFVVDPPPTYAALVGTPDFDAEDLLALEAGYRRILTPSLFADLTIFHNTYDGLSGFGPFVPFVEPNPVPHLLFTTTYSNAIRAVSDGLELAADLRPRPWFRARGTYALLTTDAESLPGFDDLANVALFEGSAPRHQGSVQVSLTLPRGVELDYTQRAVGRLRAHDVPGYVTGDVRAAWQLDRGVMLALAGQNLFAPGHIEFYRDDFPPVGIRRSVYASVTWRR